MTSHDKKKIIAVVGATGNQGSSVARTFLSLPNWQVRCLTRNPSSAAATRLSDEGAEVVKADLADVSSLADAFVGAAAIFVNTDFWQLFGNPPVFGPDMAAVSARSYATEVAHGTNAAIAAAAVPTLERYVYSTFVSMKAGSGGKYTHSGHWESKAAVAAYIQREQPALASKTSWLYAGAYDTNPMLRPWVHTGSGEYGMMLPCSPSTLFPVIEPMSATGPFVRALVEEEEAGASLLAYNESLTVAEVLEQWSRRTGKKASFRQVTVEEMVALTGFPLEVVDGPAFIGDFGYLGGKQVMQPSQLKAPPVLKSFSELLQDRQLQELL